MSLNSPESTPANPSYAVLRAGLVGGATLGLAMAGQRMATSQEMALLGWFIVIFGFFCVGHFAVRELTQIQNRRAIIRLGLVSGLIAGIVAGLAFVFVNLALSLDTEQLQLMRASALERMSQMTPQQAQALKDSHIDADLLAQWSYGLATGCCGLMVPIMGSVLGAFGALSASNKSSSSAEPSA